MLKTNGYTDIELNVNQTLPVRIIILLSTLFVASSIIPVAILSGFKELSISLSYSIFALSSATFFFTAKKISSAIWRIAVMMFLFYFTASPILPALLFGAVLSIGAVSAMIRSGKGLKLSIAFLVLIVPYGVSFILTSNPFVSVAALIFAVPALFLAIPQKLGSDKTTAIASSAVSIFAMTAGVCLLVIYNACGSITLETINASVENFRAYLIDNCINAFNLLDQIEFTEHIRLEIVALVNYYVNLSVGIVGAIALVVSYAAHNVQCNVFRSASLNRYLTERETKLSVSATAAIIFVAAHVLSFATSPSGNMSLAATVAQNLCLLLIPGLLVAGFSAVKALFKKIGPFLGILLTIFVISMFSSSVSLPTLIALVGAFFVIFRSIDSWANVHYGKGEHK